MLNIESHQKRIKIFLISSLAGIRVNLVGQLPLSEFFALIYSLNPQSWIIAFRKIPDIKKINVAYAFFFISQIISDIINHSDLVNTMRGLANIIMAMVVITFLARLLWGSLPLIIIFFIGDIIRLIFFAPSSEGLTLDDMGFFKFRLAPILNDMILICSWYLLKINKYNKKYVIILFGLYGLFCFGFDFRSNGMFILLTSVILLKPKVFNQFTFKKFAIYAVFLGLIFQVSYSIYVSQVLAGNFGGKHSLTQLKMMNDPYNPIYLLIIGRTETFIALKAIQDKPFFGHGSWAPDPGGKYTALALELRGDENEKKFNNYMDNKEHLIIPSHSIIFGAWMTAGIGGFLSIIYIAFLFFKRGMRLLKNPMARNSPYFAIIVFFMINGAWTLLFSPLPHIRQSLPIMLAFILVMNRQVFIFDKFYSLELIRVQRDHGKTIS